MLTNISKTKRAYGVTQNLFSQVSKVLFIRLKKQNSKHILYITFKQKHVINKCLVNG